VIEGKQSSSGLEVIHSVPDGNAARQVFCQSSYDEEGSLNDGYKVHRALPMAKKRSAFHMVSKKILSKQQKTDPICRSETANTTQIIQVEKNCCPNSTNKDCKLYGFGNRQSTELKIPDGNATGSN